MTRKIANWFHDREEELFTESETPFTREEIVHVINDSVDPIQQVMVDGEKYIGVISYDEHDGWYEYTRWNDSAGEVNMGVCAKCVEEAEYVDEVARTIGDSTDIARQKFSNHYSDEHTVKPDEIETGATLLSGTTINGNTAIHPGMDGHGSGVDADFVLGNEALQTGSFYSFSETTQGNTLDTVSLSTPGGSSKDAGFDSNGSIWYGGYTSIYQINLSSSIISQFNTPSTSPEGVDFDSGDCIWHSDSSTVSIYKLNQSGGVDKKFSAPSSDARGLGVDTTDCIWICDVNDSIWQLDRNGGINTKFSTPSDIPEAVSADLDDCIWHVDSRNNGSVYHLDQTGAVLNQFQSPSTNPNGVGTDNSNSLWVVAGTDAIFNTAKFSAIQF